VVKAFAGEQARVLALDARAADVVYLGTEASEQAHDVIGPSETILYRGRSSRLARAKGWFEFQMKTGDGSMSLQLVLRGDEHRGRFRLLIDGKVIATDRLEGLRGSVFFEQDYPIPAELTRSRQAVTVRIEADGNFPTGPIYCCRLLRAGDVSAASA
jgi:hypothetical protein